MRATHGAGTGASGSASQAAAARLMAFCCTARRVLIWARVRSKEKMPCTHHGEERGQGVLHCSVHPALSMCCQGTAGSFVMIPSQHIPSQPMRTRTSTSEPSMLTVFFSSGNLAGASVVALHITGIQ